MQMNCKEEMVYYCRECGQLDFGRGRCSKCGSADISLASQDMMFGNAKSLNMTQYVYEPEMGFL